MLAVTIALLAAVMFARRSVMSMVLIARLEYISVTFVTALALAAVMFARSASISTLAAATRLVFVLIALLAAVMLARSATISTLAAATRLVLILIAELAADIFDLSELIDDSWLNALLNRVETFMLAAVMLAFNKLIAVACTAALAEVTPLNVAVTEFAATMSACS